MTTTTETNSSTSTSAETKAPELFIFHPYIAEIGADKVAGTHLITCLYRKPKGGGNPKHQNAAVYVPEFINADWIAENIDTLQEYFEGYLTDKLGELVKSKYETVSNKRIGKDECNGAALLAYLEATATTSRLSGDDVKAWFATSIQPALAAAITAKLGFDGELSEAQQTKLDKLLAVYLSKFVSLAGRPSLNKTEAESLLRALEIAKDAGSDIGTIGRKFTGRLNKITETEEELLDNL